MAPSDYTNKTIALVTGANQGIGLAAATALARDFKYHVIIGARKPDAGKKVVKDFADQGWSASFVEIDLEKEETITAAAEHLTSEYGRLDVLVNNAAILIDSSPFAGTMSNLFHRTFQTNVIGTALLTDALVPLLEKSSNPNVVFVSSRMGSAHYSKDPTTVWYNMDCKAYDSSKAALNVLALNYDRILKPAGAKVNVVCPGLVSTNLHEGVKAGAPPEVGAKRVIELATLSKDGPSATWSASDEPEIPW